LGCTHGLKYKPFKYVIETETVIAPPKFDEDWNAWYTNMKDYQDFLRKNLNDTSLVYLELKVKKDKKYTPKL
jgi:hypothetical protein